MNAGWWVTGWPYVGVAIAAVLVVLLATPVLRNDPTVPRFRDPAWLAWAALTLYLVHQFEEYGVDAAGVQHAFPEALCTILGFGGGGCPVPPSFYVAVNLGSVWGGGLIAALLARRFPAAGLTLVGTIGANAIVHIGGAIARGEYNPGLLTSVLLFVPFTVWVAVAVFVRGPLGASTFVLIMLGGVLQHAVLMGSVAAFAHGPLPKVLLLAIQLANAGVALAFLAVFRRWSGRRGPAPRDAAGVR